MLFSVAVCLFLCGPLVLCAAQKMCAPVPEWLTAAPARYLAGGSSNSKLLPNLTIEGFANKKLQSAAEDKVGSFIPLKANALLANAFFQRATIAGSADLEFMECYPTHYDSSIIYSPLNRALSQMPLRDTEEVEKGIGEFAAKFSDLAQRFPNKKFIVIIADNSNTSLSNPALQLVSDPYTTSMANVVFTDACAELNNVSVVDAACVDAREYYQKFYRTDHHWNGWGAVDAYMRALDALDDQTSQLRVPLENLSPLDGFEWLVEHGSACRNGLMLVDESVNEPALPLRGVTLEKGDPPFVLARDGVACMQEVGPIASYDFYQTWYGQWLDTVAVNSEAVLPDSSALVVCDSFGTAFKWVASTGFGCVATLYDLHDSRTETVPLSKTLESSDSDTVFLVARVTSYQKVLDRFPEYLD